MFKLTLVTQLAILAVNDNTVTVPMFTLDATQRTSFKTIAPNSLESMALASINGKLSEIDKIDGVDASVSTSATSLEIDMSPLMNSNPIDETMPTADEVSIQMVKDDFITACSENYGNYTPNDVGNLAFRPLDFGDRFKAENLRGKIEVEFSNIDSVGVVTAIFDDNGNKVGL